jgi:hypothetical protein
MKKLIAKRRFAKKNVLLVLDQLTIRSKLESMSEKKALSVCRVIFLKNKDRVVLNEVVAFLVPLALKGSSGSKRLLENIAVTNPDYTVRHNAIRSFYHLARKGIPISLSVLKRIRADPLPTNRGHALSAAIQMAKRGNHAVLSEFIYAIQNEKFRDIWELAELGFFELAEKGNKIAKQEIQKIERKEYKKPTRLVWNLKEFGIKE